MLKTVSSITNAIGALNYKGTWNASTNSPALASGVGTKGDYYVVSVAGSTNLDGETLWGVGDWAVYNGTAWQKVEGGNTINATTVSASTSVTTPIVQSSTSAGTTLKNASGTTCIQYGAGGGTNVTIEAAINMNGANAHIEMSPTGTGHVTINPTAVGDMDNMVIGATVPKAGSFTTATATSINKMAITAPATSSTLAVADGKTLTASNSLTLAGTDATTMTFPTTSATIARTDAAQTFTGAQTFGETILGTNAAKVFNSGGVSIGNTTDPGATNLSVTGTAIITGKVATGTTAGGWTGDGNLVSQATGGWAVSAYGNGAHAMLVRVNNTTKYLAAFYYTSSQVGGITTDGTNTAYGTSSDYRLKENIAPLTGALATLAKLKPVTYTWISNKAKGQGFIAHELQEVVPECVIGAKDEINEDGSIKAQNIDASFLVATLTSALQELNAKFDAYVALHP